MRLPSESFGWAATRPNYAALTGGTGQQAAGVFAGGREGYFYALNARDGELLWKTSVGGGVASGPMSYSIGGKQYIAISAGNSLFVYGLRE